MRLVPARPDFVLIMTDQQRFDQVGFASAGQYETANVDSLAARGVTFANAYSGSTTCVPARASLLTGVHHHRLPTQVNRLALREGFWTVAHSLRQVGYETALIGKMHFAPVRAQHGFDISRLCEHLGVDDLRPASGVRHEDVDDYHESLAEHGIPDWRAEPPQARRGCETGRRARAPFPYPARFHPTEWVKHEALSFLRRRDHRRPVLLVVSFPHPHAPYNPPAPYDEMYDPDGTALPADGFVVNERLPPVFRNALARTDGPYAPQHLKGREEEARRWLRRTRQLIRQIDDAVGEILEEVDLSRSIVFFTSDHGDYAGHRGMLKKVPWIPFDDLARVPLVVAGQGVVGGRRVSTLVQNCDFALTCLDYAGVEGARRAFDTESLRPLLADGPGAARDDRRVLCATSAGWPMVRRSNLKYVVEERSASAVLFDLAQDPAETVSVLDDPSYRAEAEDLGRFLEQELGRGIPDLPAGKSGSRRRPAAMLNVPARFVRGAFDDHDESVRSAHWLIRHICDHLSLGDLSGTDVLDFGCGVKLSEALINDALPIKRYVGFDVYRDLITFLQENVEDDRFEYFHVNARNALYNPDGEPLTAELPLSIDGQTFDLIVLLSVFTHLEPTDYRAMLKLLRRFAKPGTVLLYSLYIDELTPGGHGLMDSWARTLSEAGERFDDALAEHIVHDTGARRIAPFKDLDPSRPLRWALYSESFARQLIDGTGWKVVGLSRPDLYIQHHFVCNPC